MDSTCVQPVGVQLANCQGHTGRVGIKPDGATVSDWSLFDRGNLSIHYIQNIESRRQLFQHINHYIH